MIYLPIEIKRYIGIAGLVILLVISGEAQSSRTVSVERRIDDFRKQSERQAREELSREMRGRQPTAEERRVAEAKKAQIKEDFDMLQSAYNDILERLHAKETLTSGYTQEITGKIAKSAARLRQNIEFPAPKTDVKAAEASPPPASMKSLCFHIYAFLTSPIFETGVLDLVEAEKARDSLDAVVRIAENLRTNN
jgi:hypothetical protein